MKNTERKKVILELEGYNFEQVAPALIRQFFKDNPEATLTKSVRALKMSRNTIIKYMKKYGIEAEKPLSAHEKAVLAKLSKRGYRVVPPNQSTPVNGEPDKISKYSAILDGLLAGRDAVVTLRGLKMSTAKAYTSTWNARQEEIMKFSFTEDSEGIRVKRTR